MLRLFTLIALMTLITGCDAIDNFFGAGSTDSVQSLPETSVSSSGSGGVVGSDDNAGDDMPEPPLLTLELADPVTMDTGSYCWTEGDTALCVDKIPPSYIEADAISVTPGELSLTFASTPPTSVNAYVHPDINILTRIADISLDFTLDGDTLTVTLPDMLDGTGILVVTAVWEDGDSFYSLPIVVE